MLFESANQGIIFLTMIYFGFIAGIVDKLPALLFLKIKHKWGHILGDILRPIIFFTIFFLGICLCNYGEFRIYCLVGCVLGFWLEKQFFEKTIIKIFVVTWLWIKNLCLKIFRKRKKESLEKTTEKI